MIDIPELGDDHHETWTLLMDLAADIQRATRDADLLVNIRVAANGTELLSRALVERGFDLPAVAPDGIGHRFVHGGVRVDVLAPANTGTRARLHTMRPHRTIRVPGGIGALNRTTVHEIRSRDRTGCVFAPDLLGAAIATVRAIDVDDAPRDTRVDATLLLSVVDDPQPLVAEVTPAERRHLRRHSYFADPTDPVWDAALRPELGASVYARLADL